MQRIDVAIVGAGPAGLTAGIYLARAQLKAIIFEKAIAGGRMAISEWIENFPGFSEGISGAELAAKMREQALACGAEFIEEEVVEIKKEYRVQPAPARYLGGPGSTEYRGFIIKTAAGKKYQSLAVIIATGSQPKKMGIPGEQEFTGRGVSYCATCDAPLFKAKSVVVIGGGDTAVQEALFLAKHAKKVYLVHRRDKLRATKILAERLASSGNIEPVWNSIATGITGDKKVKAVKIANADAQRANADLRRLECDGVFIFAGIVPNSDIVKGLVKLDKDGYIITDEDMRASVDGIFSCGDVRKKLLRQVVTACGEAATASFVAQHYVEELKGTAYK